MFVYIYRITNTVNGKLYVGQTALTAQYSLQSYFKTHLDRSRNGSHRYIHRAIRKYGPESFVMTVQEQIPRPPTKEETQVILDEREMFWIAELQTQDPTIGYNMNAGGGGCTDPSQETREKLRKAQTGRRFSDESKARMSRERKGIKKSPEATERLAQANRLRAITNPESVNMWKGKKRTQENVQKSVASRAKQWLLTDPNGQTYTIKNLADFCREHNLNHRAMGSVSRGEWSKHRGWTCQRLSPPKVNRSRGRKQTPEAIAKSVAKTAKWWTAIGPTGENFGPFQSLNSFCQEHHLDQGEMSKVSRGLRKHHKGWTCQKKSEAPNPTERAAE